jgi:hypothetical protein
VLSRPQCRWAQPYHLDQGDALGLEAYAGRNENRIAIFDGCADINGEFSTP